MNKIIFVLVGLFSVNVYANDIACTRELLSKHRYGIGHLINYLDQE